MPPHADEVHVDSRLSPDEDVARLERMRAFRRVIDQLAEKKRTVFMLHELEGRSPAEISKIVGAPVLTVRTRLFYARRELAEMLKHEPTLAAFAQAFERSGTDERAEAEQDGRGGEMKFAILRACPRKSFGGPDARSRRAAAFPKSIGSGSRRTCSRSCNRPRAGHRHRPRASCEPAGCRRRRLGQLDAVADGDRRRGRCGAHLR